MNRRFSAVFRRFQAVFRRFPPVSIFFVATAPSHRYSRLCLSLKPPTNLGTISAPFLHHFLHFHLPDTLQINDLRSEIAPRCSFQHPARWERRRLAGQFPASDATRWKPLGRSW